MALRDSSVDVSVPPAGAAALITLQGVAKTYQMGDNAVHALRDLNVQILAGQFVGVTGRSGSGKSTLLHLLAGMEGPSTGSIHVQDWPIHNLDAKTAAQYRRTMVGMIFQSFNLVATMSALMNVELPLVLAGVAPNVRRARALACLDWVDLSHRQTHRPAELSGGEQQRVAIARALVHDPPILLADEPTGNLDSDTAQQIVNLLARAHTEQGKTVLVVTHHLAEIEAVIDRRLHLNDGALTHDAPC